MTHVRITVDTEVSEELLASFPTLHARVQPHPRSTITGDLADSQELQGVLNFLASMGVGISDVVVLTD